MTTTKKVIAGIFMLLFFNSAYSQTAGRIFTKCGPPAGAISGFVKAKDIYWDSCANLYYMQRTNAVYYLINFAKGQNGTSATVNVGNTTTLPAGSQATVTNRGTADNIILDFGIPQGQSGQGGTSNINGFESPDFYGAVHKQQAITSANVGMYSSVGAVIGDQVDWAALSMAYKNANRKGVLLYGEYYVNRTIFMNQFDYYDVTLSLGAIIYTTNATTYPVLGRLTANSESDAVRMQTTIIFIQNLDIQIHGSQIGFQPQPASNVTLTNVRVFGQGTGTGFLLQFDMNANLTGCLSHTTTDGFVLTWGGFPTSTNTNSQCNGSILSGCMAYNVSNYPFKIEQAYQVILLGCYAQGSISCTAAVYFDAQNTTTVKDFTVNNFHWEQNGGATAAIFYLRMQNGSVEINNLNFQSLVPSTYIDAAAQQSMLVVMKRQNYWKDGSHYKTNSSVDWKWYDSISMTQQASVNPANWVGGIVPRSTIVY